MSQIQNVILQVTVSQNKHLHCASWHSSATLTEDFLCFFLSCKANARVKPAKMGHSPHYMGHGPHYMGHGPHYMGHGLH
jgi:hypothetical protein